jgi:hypothetical protein
LPKRIILSRDAGLKHVLWLASGGNASSPRKITHDPDDFIVKLTSMIARQGRTGSNFITIHVHAARLSAVGDEVNFLIGCSKAWCHPTDLMT